MQNVFKSGGQWVPPTPPLVGLGETQDLILAYANSTCLPWSNHFSAILHWMLPPKSEIGGNKGVCKLFLKLLHEFKC